MTTKVWLYPEETASRSGEVIFRNDRNFKLWAYAVSHSQLLLRSTSGPDSQNRTYETTIDLLFKPVSAVKIRNVYRGLVIRCATAQQVDQVRSGFSSLEPVDDDRFFLLETEGEVDYVVSMSVGWREGVLGTTRRSFFAWIDPEQPRWPVAPFGAGYDAGLNIATTDELMRALADADSNDPVRRERFRDVYVLMTQVESGDISGAGVFLTEADADDARAMIASSVVKSWIERLPIAI